MAQDIKKYEKEIKDLALLVDKVEDEKLQITNQLKKVLADYTNLENNLEKRALMRGDMIKIEIAKSLLKVMDDIHFALKNSNTLKLTPEVKNWVDGINASLLDIEKVLEELGISKIVVNKGEPFDSSVHEAVSSLKGGQKNTVFDLMQPGFVLGDIVIRPARVVISLGD